MQCGEINSGLSCAGDYYTPDSLLVLERTWREKWRGEGSRREIAGEIKRERRGDRGRGLKVAGK